MFAHQTGYINDGHEGENAGMNPAAITMIVVGLNNSNQYVLNSHSGVYDHFSPCPITCEGVNDVYVH